MERVVNRCTVLVSRKKGTAKRGQIYLFAAKKINLSPFPDRETGGIVAVRRGVDRAELPEPGAATEARLERKARFHAELTPTVGGLAVE